MIIIPFDITLYFMLFDGIINFIPFMLTILFFFTNHIHTNKTHIHTDTKLISIKHGTTTNT